MPAPRKPKKVFIQFAVALVVAAVLGIGALIAGFTIISGVSIEAETARKEAEKKVAEAEAKLKEAERLKQEQAANPTSAPMTYKVVQAMGEIRPGEPITKNMLSLVEVQERPLPGTVSQLSQAVGKMAKVRIMEGEALEMGKLLDASSMLSVESGMRALTINVDTIGGLNGALMPGMRVDILATVTKDEKPVTRTVLQNVQVIGVAGGGAALAQAAVVKGAAPAASGGNGGPITLAVTPKQAELLTLANQTSQIHLTLRNYGDKVTAKVPGADLTALMAGIQADALKKPMPKLPPEPKNGGGASGFHNVNYTPGGNLPNPPDSAGLGKSKFSMQIYRGTGTETVDFEQ